MPRGRRTWAVQIHARHERRPMEQDHASVFLKIPECCADLFLRVNATLLDGFGIRPEPLRFFDHFCEAGGDGTNGVHDTTSPGFGKVSRYCGVSGKQLGVYTRRL